jgi:hypothetical protein
MTNPGERRLIEDLAAASAAYLFNLLPGIVNLPASERFTRLAAHIEGAVVAYADAKQGWYEGRIPEPSVN